MSRSMSLSAFISPVAAEPKRMIFSGEATERIRRTISSSVAWSMVIADVASMFVNTRLLLGWLRATPLFTNSTLLSANALVS